MKCQYRDNNNVLRTRSICNGVLDDTVIPAITMCREQLYLSIDGDCAETTVAATSIPGPTPTPTSTSNKILFISSIVNFKSTGSTLIYRVADGKRLLIDTLEMVTLEAIGLTVPPYISFGTSSDSSAYYGPIVSTSVTDGARHIIDNPQKTCFFHKVGKRNIHNNTSETDWNEK